MPILSSSFKNLTKFYNKKNQGKIPFKQIKEIFVEKFGITDLDAKLIQNADKNKDFHVRLKDRFAGIQRYHAWAATEIQAEPLNGND
jgi:hypothetical protein